MGEDRATHGSWAAQGDPAYADLLRAQEAFEFAPDAQVRTDFAGVLVAANYAATDLLRCPKEFLPGKPLGLFVAEGHRAEFYNTLIRAIKGDVAAAVETRLARQMLTFAEQYGQKQENGDTLIMLRLTQGDLAAMTGCSREHVNKVIVSYKERGYLSVDRQYHFTLHNLAALERRA